MNGRTLMSLACGVAALCAAPVSTAARDGSAAQQRLEFSVGYTSPHALAGLHVDGGVPALRIARVRLTPAAAQRVARVPGIRFVQQVRRRKQAAEPALQLATGKSVPWEWQFTAVDENSVPEVVLRAASSVTIAVLDTGADLSAPDIAAKNPVTFSARTGTSDVRDTAGHGTFVAA